MELEKHEQIREKLERFLRVHSFVLEKKESGGLDDKFGGGNVITETLAASVVTSAMLQSTAIFSRLWISSH